MIPKNSTPIKNEILTEIFGKGLLTYLEMRIASYIIRWSWGFDGTANRRQDWTNPLTKSLIAKDVNADYKWCRVTISNMIKAGKLITNGKGQYQFNEHYENWTIGQKTLHRAENTTGQKTLHSRAKNTIQEGKKHYIPSLYKETSKETVLKKRGPAAPALAENQPLFNEIRNYWNSNAGNPSAHDSIPQIIALTPWRVEKLKARLKEHAFIKHWKEAIGKATASAFCRGKNDRGWKIDFSWFIENGNNYIKVLEGKYDDKQKPKGKYAHLEDKYEE